MRATPLSSAPVSDAATLVLGIDIGTSSSKGVLVDGDHGRVVTRAEVEHAMSFPRPGWVEHDAEGVWWADFAALTRELLRHGRCSATSPACTRGPSASSWPPRT